MKQHSTGSWEPRRTNAAHGKHVTFSTNESAPRNWQSSHHSSSDGDHPIHQEAISFSAADGSATNIPANNGIFAPAPVRPRFNSGSLLLRRRLLRPLVSKGRGAAVGHGNLDSLTFTKESEREMGDNTPEGVSDRMERTWLPFSTPQNACPTASLVSECELETPKNKGSITDGDTIREFFSIDGLNIHGGNWSNDGIGSLASSCSVLEESVIDFDAALLFRRSGARRARPAGPGFDVMPSY